MVDIVTLPVALSRVVARLASGSLKDATPKEVADLPAFLQSGTGSVLRSINSKIGEIVSVTDFGATGDGVIDDTVATQAAHDALPTNGGHLRFPAGTYLIGTLNITKSITISGDGSKASLIKSVAATGVTFNVTVDRVEIYSIGFIQNVTRTAGAFVHFDVGSNQSHLHDFFMSGYYIGVQITAAATVRISHGSIRAGATTSGTAGILVDGGNDHFINNITMDAPSGSQPLAGIQIVDSGATLITDCDIIHHTNDLLINPGDGQSVASCYAINTFFDTAERGILIDPSGTGVILRSHFIGCWTSSHTQQGVLINSGGTGVRTGIQFTNHDSFLNGSNGLQVEKGTDIRILGGMFAQNTGNGIAIGDNVNEFSIIGIRSGASAGLTANTSFGILVFGTSHNNYVISNNDLRGNTSGSLSDNGTGTTKNITNNLGFNPVGATGITVTASPFTYTNTSGFTQSVQINSGTVSNITLASNPVGTATETTIVVPHNQSLTVTYSVVPNMQYLGQ